MATLQNGALDCVSLEMKCICGWRDLSVHIFWCDRTDRAGTNRRGHRWAANWAPSAHFIPVVCFIHPLEVSSPSLRHPSSGCPPFTGLLEAQIIHPLRFPLSCLTSHVLRVQTANDVAHHGNPSHSIRIPPSQEYTRNQPIRLCPFLVFFFFFLTTVTEKQTNTSLKLILFSIFFSV